MVRRVNLRVVAFLTLLLASCTSSASQSPEIKWCGRAFDQLAALPSLQGVVSFPSEGTRFAAYPVAYRLLAGMPGAPKGLIPRLVSLADLADALQAEVNEGRGTETIVNGSTFDAFFAAGSAFGAAFDEACPEPPPSVGPARESSSVPSQIGFTSVAPPGT